MVLPPCLFLPLAYLSLEVLAFSIYAYLAGPRSSEYAIEATLKYYLLSSVSSMVLLLAILSLSLSLGSLNLLDTLVALLPTSLLSLYSPNLLLDFLIAACSFILAGIAFKLALAPFITWLPEVYEGSLPIVCLILATTTKIPLMALLLSLWYHVAYSLNQATLLKILLFASISLGTVASIAQYSWKRLIAFSGTVHAGFMLLSLTVLSAHGITALLAYLLVYSLITTSYVLILCSWHQEASSFSLLPPPRYLTAIASYSKASPNTLIAFIIISFNFIGLPPTSGFHTKLLILIALITSAQPLIAFIAFALKVLSATYYLRVLSYSLNRGAPTVTLAYMPRSTAYILSNSTLLSLGGYLKPALLAMSPPPPM